MRAHHTTLCSSLGSTKGTLDVKLFPSSRQLSIWKPSSLYILMDVLYISTL